MIIPILASAGPESTEGLEWVMLELNGELLKPLDINDETSHHRNPRRSRSLSPDGTAAAAADDDDVRRRVELGSVRFDSDVSLWCATIIYRPVFEGKVRVRRIGGRCIENCGTCDFFPSFFRRDSPPILTRLNLRPHDFIRRYERRRQKNHHILGRPHVNYWQSRIEGVRDIIERTIRGPEEEEEGYDYYHYEDFPHIIIRIHDGRIEIVPSKGCSFGSRGRR